MADLLMSHRKTGIVPENGNVKEISMDSVSESATLKSTSLLLRNVFLFTGLSDEQLGQIEKIAVLRQESRNKTVVFVGAEADTLFIIVRGSVKVLSRDADGHEVILSVLEAGESFGEMGLIDDLPRSADVVTNDPCDLLMIRKADFTRTLFENKDICWNVMKSLVLRLREANHKIEGLALMDVYGRVAKLLLDSSEIEDGVRVVKRKLTKLDMAKMVGASREMVSRVMRDLERRGVIRNESKRIILNKI
jgi:CRP/FNR family cyclic AMP-dependent transcriptional regulator